MCPAEYIGNVQKLVHDRRGEYVHMHYLDQNRVEFLYEIPLAEAEELLAEPMIASPTEKLPVSPSY